MAQGSLERGRYLVDTVMTCHNCHTPKGPNGPQFDKALSGGLRFDEPAFDVTASNITPDRDTGIGSWSDAEIRGALLEGTRPAGHHLAPVMPSGYYKILTPGDLDGIVAYLRSVPPVANKVSREADVRRRSWRQEQTRLLSRHYRPLHGVPHDARLVRNGPRLSKLAGQGRPPG